MLISLKSVAGCSPMLNRILQDFTNSSSAPVLCASGGESEVRLSVDSIFPNGRLFAALAEFARLFPYVQPKLRQTTFLSADAEFSVHNAQLCITGLLSREFFTKPILAIRMVAVARRDHPMHAVKRKLNRPDLMQHTLVTIEGAASGTLKHQPRVPAQRVLHVSSIEAAIDAVRSGLCFGWLPAYRIQSDVAAGELVPCDFLPAARGKSGSTWYARISALSVAK